MIKPPKISPWSRSATMKPSKTRVLYAFSQGDYSLASNSTTLCPKISLLSPRITKSSTLSLEPEAVKPICPPTPDKSSSKTFSI